MERRRARTIGSERVWGHFAVVIKALAYIYCLGFDGLKAGFVRCRLGANYLQTLLKKTIICPTTVTVCMSLCSAG